MSNTKKLLNIKYTNLKPSDSITQYIEKKISKHRNEAYGVIAVNCNISLESQKAGKLYNITVDVALPHFGFIVREKGRDIYKMIDEISDKYRKRLTQFIDKHEKKNSASMSGDNLDNIKYDLYIDTHLSPEYKIVEKKSFSSENMIHPEEAIERMETLGRTFFLFRNFKTGKYSVVYKIEKEIGKIEYGLAEVR